MTHLDARGIARHGLLDAYRARGTTTWLDANGPSMRPLIPAGSRLLVEFGRVPERVGEVILFNRGEGVVAHRLVKRRRTADGLYLIAKGDAESFLDPAVREEDVLGVVRWVVRPDGTAARGVLGRQAMLLARVSWWSGQAAGVGARIARGNQPSAPMRQVALRAHLYLSRVPTRVITALIPRFDRGDTAGRR